MKEYSAGSIYEGYVFSDYPGLTASLCCCSEGILSNPSLEEFKA